MAETLPSYEPPLPISHLPRGQGTPRVEHLLTDWYARAVEMNRTLGTHLHIPTWYYDLMNHDEARRAGLDLADVLIFK